MGVAEASAERYSDPMHVGAYLEAEWGDKLRHLMPPSPDSGKLFEPCTSSFYREVAEFAREAIGERNIETACDVGCATGRFLYEFSRLFPRLTDLLGVEPSPVFTDYARKFLLGEGDALSDWVPVPGSPVRPVYIKLSEDFFASVRVGEDAARALSVFTGMGEDAPRPEEYFDVLFCLNVVDRHPNPGSLVKRLGTLLQDGGLFFIASPMDWDRRFTPREHWVGELSELFDKGGWEQAGVRDIEYPFRYTVRYMPEYISQVVCMRKTGGGG